MAAADVRDMLDLPQDGQPRPAKKQKLTEKRPEGVSRELYALLGDGQPPPITLTENTKYKGRRKLMSKVKPRPWEMAPFTNSARSDNLALRHWRMKTAPPPKPPAPDGSTEMDVDDKKEAEASETKQTEDYLFAKFNIKPQTPRKYTDQEYEKHLQSDTWSREETDYLMDLAESFDLRWIVIADRYDYQSQTPESDTNSTALVPASKSRTMEDLKSRYYTIAAKMLAIEHPLPEMSESEFNLYETMMKFNPEREKSRKDLAVVQFNRTKEEVQEEALLLEELKRIVMSEKSFIEERKELYARLEAPVSTGNTAVYQSSHGLGQLLQSLLQADKNKKRRSLLGPEQVVSSPSSQAPTQTAASVARDSRTETPAATTQPTTKKGAASVAQQAAIRTLTPAEEIKYGVTHHDRLTSGVQFRNDKAQKLAQAKSNVQSQKIAAALTELEIPPRLFMPTEKVCKEFERLIHSVNLLLDARKYSEKVEGEIRVIEATKHDREEKEAIERGEIPDPAKKNPEDDATAEVDTEEKGKQGGSLPDTSTASKPVDSQGIKLEADGETAADAPTANSNATQASPSKSATSHKRSASILSAVSEKSPKKQKK